MMLLQLSRFCEVWPDLFKRGDPIRSGYKKFRFLCSFLDVAAEASGQWINYSKLSSDHEIPKETLRRFYTLLEDTLIVHRVESFRPKISKRRMSQRDRFVFFDLGVRNALLGIHSSNMSALEKGNLFEQWIYLQILAFHYAEKKSWRIFSFRTDTGSEVDWILDTGNQMVAIECKLAKNVSGYDFNGLKTFESFAARPVKKFVVFTGTSSQKFSSTEFAVPYEHFLNDILPSLK